jgi:hypothetical protein
MRSDRRDMIMVTASPSRTRSAMTVRSGDQERLADESRRGQDAFERIVKPHLRPEDDGKFVAIDIATGSYEIDPDDYQATERLLARTPDARVWLLRAGSETTYRILGNGQVNH